MARTLALLLILAGSVTCGLGWVDAVRAQPPVECDGAFNGWVSGVGAVTAVSRYRIAVRWDIATDGVARVGRHAVRLSAGCHYRLLTGTDVTPATPTDVVLRVNRKTPFVGDVRPRVGQIVQFVVWRAPSPLPADIARGQVRSIGVYHGATTSIAAITG